MSAADVIDGLSMLMPRFVGDPRAFKLLSEAIAKVEQFGDEIALLNREIERLRESGRPAGRE